MVAIYSCRVIQFRCVCSCMNGLVSDNLWFWVLLVMGMNEWCWCCYFYCVPEFRNLCELLWKVWDNNRLSHHERPAHTSTQGIRFHNLWGSFCCRPGYPGWSYNQWQAGYSFFSEIVQCNSFSSFYPTVYMCAPVSYSLKYFDPSWFFHCIFKVQLRAVVAWFFLFVLFSFQG